MTLARVPTRPAVTVRSGLDPLFQMSRSPGHLDPGLPVNEERDKDSPDPVALELERDSQARSRLGKGFDGDLNGGPDVSVDATDTPRARRVDVSDFGGHLSVGTTDAAGGCQQRLPTACVSNGSGWSMRPLATTPRCPLGEACWIGCVGEDLSRLLRSTSVLTTIALTSFALRHQRRVAGQVKRPSLVAVHAFRDSFPLRSVAFEVSVLQFDAGALRRLGRNRTSTSLVISGLVTMLHSGLISQLKTRRNGGS